MIAPLIINGEEWRRREDPDAGLTDGGLWVRRVVHPPQKDKAQNVQHYGASSPRPTTRHDCEAMLAYLTRLAPILPHDPSGYPL
jgi:hypothetical protein